MTQADKKPCWPQAAAGTVHFFPGEQGRDREQLSKRAVVASVVLWVDCGSCLGVSTLLG